MVCVICGNALKHRRMGAKAPDCAMHRVVAPGIRVLQVLRPTAPVRVITRPVTRTAWHRIRVA